MALHSPLADKLRVLIDLNDPKAAIRGPWKKHAEDIEELPETTCREVVEAKGKGGSQPAAHRTPYHVLTDSRPY